MYVLEMRSYMRDADGTGSRDPISRISRHEDTNGDGTYDRSTVFADGLVLPRMAFPLQDGVILVLETDNRDMYKYTDTDGDGVADRKELFYENVESQAAASPPPPRNVRECPEPVASCARMLPPAGPICPDATLLSLLSLQ